MSFQELLNNVGKTARRNSPAILTGISVAGVITTAYLTAKATIKAQRVIEQREVVGEDPKERLKENLKATWPLYIPPAMAGVVTIGCIVGGSKISANRTAAAVAAYSVTEKAFSQYKEKVVEQFNATKEEKIRAAIAQDKVNGVPVPAELLAAAEEDRKKVEGSSETLALGPGRVRCFEEATGRYFLSDKQSIMAAMNEVNGRLNHGADYVTLNYFYDLLGLGHTQFSGDQGWIAPRLMDIDFFFVGNEDFEPCLAFAYNYVTPL